MTDRHSHLKYIFFSIGIVLLAFGLRFSGVRFGLPYLYHADESIVVNHALAYGSGSLNPHFFRIPPLTSYLLYVCYGLYFLAGKALNVFSSVLDFERMFFADPASFYFLARLIFGVFLGTVTVAVFMSFLRRVLSGGAALFGGLIFAVCFLHVRDSHYIYADIPLVLVLTLLLGSLWTVYSDPGRGRSHIVFGCLLGLASAIKYNGVFIVVPYLLLTIFRGKKSEFFRFVSLAAAVSVVTFIGFNPYAILDMPFFLSELRAEAAAHGGVSFWHHLQYSLREGTGGGILVAALGGMLTAIARRDIFRISLAVYAVVYYGVLVLGGQSYDRYVLPLLPVLIFLAVDFCFYVSGKLGKTGIFFLLGCLFLFSAGNLAKSLDWNRVMLNGDTRTEAKAWIEANIPTGSKIALDGSFFTPRLRFSDGQIAEKERDLNRKKFSETQARRLRYYAEETRRNQAPSYDLFFLKNNPQPSPFLFASPEIPFDIQLLRGRGIQYVVLVRFHPEENKNAEFAEEVKKHGRLLKMISPYHDPMHDAAIDRQPLTGGPFLWEDIQNRKINGLPLEIYQLDEKS